MNAALLLFAAVLSMVAGHIFKVRRWGLFISVYEEPSFRVLLSSLTIGHTLNMLLPVRLGDIFRVWSSGRKLKNGNSLALATVLAELYVDLLCVGLMFSGLLLLGKGGGTLRKVARAYIAILTLIVPLMVLCAVFRKEVKRLIAAAAGIFNERIEFRVLYVSYLTIASLKDLVQKIDKTRFAAGTVMMWTGYVISYVLFAKALRMCGYNYSTSDVFTTLFFGAVFYNMDLPAGALPIWGIFLLLPLGICLGTAWLMGREPSGAAAAEQGGSCPVLPQLSRADRLSFLKTYYTEEDREHIQAYLEINRDVLILKDHSSGSNASTLLVMKDGELRFRKYAFDEDGRRLSEQIRWIERHQADIPLPAIREKRCTERYAVYDMPGYGSAVGMFQYIHTMPAEKSWAILEDALGTIQRGLHNRNVRPAETAATADYIASKVVGDLKAIRDTGRHIRMLERFDEIIVNGQSLKTLGSYKDLLSPEYLTEVFRNDYYSDIHGDLTIENLICLKDCGELNAREYDGKFLPGDYYFIDPNTGNMHESPFLDYAKLLQSLHGNYEFLMMVRNVSIEGNRVDFMMMRSEAYEQLYMRYKKWLFCHFTDPEVKSIYCHEIVHWLRLLPYKIRKDDRLAVVFYAGLLQVLADIREEIHDKG